MKARTWIFLILYIVTALWPVFANAQTTPPPPVPPNQQEVSALSLTPPDSDLSVIYLSNIFGTVDGVLAGTGSQLIGTMFRIFNGAVLVLGGIVILYTIFVSTLKTAHEGEVLGKNWSSIWIPLRSVTGIALLIPKATGYSFIQIFMMWVIVMGVGAADSVWNTALDYFTRGGILMQQNTRIDQIGNGSKVLDASADLLRSLTCMEMLQRQLQNYRNTQSTNPIAEVPNFYQGIITEINAQVRLNAASLSIPVPVTSNNYLNTNGVCGTMTWSTPVADTTGLSKDAAQQITQSRTMAVQAMITQLYGAAQRIVNNALVSDPANNRFELGHILNPGSTPIIWGAGTPGKLTNPLLAGDILSNATASYFGIMGPTLNYLQNAAKFQALIAAWIQQSKLYGWILAGRYYMNIIQLGNSQMTISEDSWPTFNVGALTNLVTNIGGIFLGGNYAQSISDLVNGTQNYQVGPGSLFITDALKYGNSLSYGQLPSVGPVAVLTSGDAVGSVVVAITNPLNKVFSNFASMQTAQQNYQNPVLLLANFGASLVTLIVDIFVGIAATMLALMTLAALLWGFTYTTVLVGVLLPILALFSPVLLAMLVSGLIMSLYIPIIPFIIFTFGAIGWLIEVIIAMIAAVLVALGIAHPEGAEILGKAEPAVGLLVSVFLRPTFMLFGLFIGMMLSYVGVWILNAGFGAAYDGVRGNLSNWETQMFGGLAAIVIYMLLVLQVVQKSFTLISVIPREVLSWIGIHGKDLGGEEQVAQQMAGDTKEAAGTGAKVITSSADTMQGMGQGIEGVAKANAANTPTPPEPEKNTRLTEDNPTPPSPSNAEQPSPKVGGSGSVKTGGGNIG